MKILLYEPDQRTGEPIYHALRREGHDVIWIQEYMDARTKILDEKFNASLIEIDDYEGLRLIESWVEQSPRLLCVAIYKEQDAGVGFKASKLGSQEIYEIEHGSIAELDRILKQYKILARLPQVYRHKSVEYNKAVSDLRNLVNHHKPVIITGEVGTGKSYLAEHVHRDDSDTVFRLEEIQCSTLNVENAMELFLGVVRGFRPEIKQHRKGLIDGRKRHRVGRVADWGGMQGYPLPEGAGQVQPWNYTDGIDYAGYGKMVGRHVRTAIFLCRHDDWGHRRGGH